MWLCGIFDTARHGNYLQAEVARDMGAGQVGERRPPDWKVSYEDLPADIVELRLNESNKIHLRSLLVAQLRSGIGVYFLRRIK